MVTSWLWNECDLTNLVMETNRLVSLSLGRVMERNGVLPTTQFLYRKGLATYDALFACPLHCKAHMRVGRILGSCRMISAQPLIGSEIKEFSISSALWVLEVPWFLY